MRRHLLLIVLIGCTANPRPQLTATACPGMTWIAVSNDWNQSIDVYAASVWQPGIIIGTVAPGNRGEFPLSDGASYSLRVSGGDSGVPVAARQRIRAQYLCR